jgi:hypothetical protein
MGLHNHTGTVGPADPVVSVNDFFLPGDPTGASADHTHTLSVFSTRPSNQTTVVTIDANTAESGYPPYVRVIFIQLAPTRPISGYTSYDLGFTFPEVVSEVTPEVAHQIQRGDHRYMQPR